MYYVYGLVDPTSNMICYVGITGNTPHKRFVQHLSRLERETNTAKGQWLSALLDNGYFPHIVTLQTVDTVQQAQITERWWIAHGQMIGWPLRNSMHLVRPTSTGDTEDGDNNTRYALDSDGTSRVEAMSIFPLRQVRELTPMEAAEVQRMVADGMSQNNIVRVVFGEKNGQRVDIVRRAIRGGA
jgi:hypothetical protein